MTKPFDPKSVVAEMVRRGLVSAPEPEPEHRRGMTPEDVKARRLERQRLAMKRLRQRQRMEALATASAS